MCCRVKTRLALREIVIWYCIKNDKEKEQLFRIIYRDYIEQWKLGLAVILRPTMKYLYKVDGTKDLKNFIV